MYMPNPISFDPWLVNKAPPDILCDYNGPNRLEDRPYTRPCPEDACAVASTCSSSTTEGLHHPGLLDSAQLSSQHYPLLSLSA